MRVVTVRRRKARSPNRKAAAGAQRVSKLAVFSTAYRESSISLKIHDPTPPEREASKYLNGPHQKFRLAVRPDKGYTSFTEPLSTLRSVLPGERAVQAQSGCVRETTCELPMAGNPWRNPAASSVCTIQTKRGPSLYENRKTFRSYHGNGVFDFYSRGPNSRGTRNQTGRDSNSGRPSCRRACSLAFRLDALGNRFQRHVGRIHRRKFQSSGVRL